MDWDDLRYFLAVARHGSLSAAAKTLDVTQPTVGRRIEAFERRLGAKLFRRTPSGHLLSPVGESVLAHAERIEQEALAAERVAGGRDVGLQGSMRVTASEWFVVRVLGPLLAPFTARHPAISIELVADARWLSLPQREADIAFRAAEFEHHQIVQREVARVAFGLYASDDYLEQRGTPDFSRQCEGHALVTMNDESIADIPWLRSIAGAARVAVTSNGREVQATMAAAGVGLACLPRCVGDATPGLRLIAPPTPPPERRIWLGVHRDTRALPRVNAFIGFSVQSLQRLAPKLRPDAPRKR